MQGAFGFRLPDTGEERGQEPIGSPATGSMVTPHAERPSADPRCRSSCARCTARTLTPHLSTLGRLCKQQEQFRYTQRVVISGR